MTAVMAPAVLGPGTRVWRGDGQAATVTETGRLGVYAVLDGERLAVILTLAAWRLALTCDYCTRTAEVQLKDGQPDDVLCKTCAHDLFGQTADWVRPIPRTAIRRLYDDCERLA